MSPKIITVVGITGIQGGSVADVFLKDPSYKVRGISRDPSKPSGKAWTEKGVEMVAANLDDLDSLTSAFKRSSVIFGVTDFWQHMFNPANHEKANRVGKTINEIAYDLEVQQGKNIVDAAAKTVDTLDRFVLSTASDAKKWSHGEITWAYHFDAKWVAVEYLKEHYPELWKKTSLLLVGVYANNFARPGPISPQKQSDGSWVLRLPCKADAPVPFIVTHKDTGYMVRGLVQSPPGKTLLGVGEMISFKEWAAKWGKLVVNQECKYEESAVEELDNTMPGGMGREIGEMFLYMGEYGYDGGDPSVVHPKDLGVNIPTTSVEEYIKSEDWSAILK
ncbi:hypothetical protein BJ546DRAFT_835245 [Cryomyces antarcticus]